MWTDSNTRLAAHPTSVGIAGEHARPVSVEEASRTYPETRIMQRWRYIGFSAIALVALAVAGRLSAQETAQEAGPPAAAAAKAPAQASQKGAEAARVTIPTKEE